MSVIKIKGSSANTGDFTIQPPDSATDRTLTLPDNTGTIISTESTVPPKVPLFKAYLNTTQSITSSTWTKIAYNTEVIDTDGWYDNTTNYRFTPQQAGYYSTTAGALIQQCNGDGLISVYKNGSESAGARMFQTSPGGTNRDLVVRGTAIIYLNGSTDYLEYYVYQDSSGVTKNLYDGGGSSDAYASVSAYLMRAD